MSEKRCPLRSPGRQKYQATRYALLTRNVFNLILNNDKVEDDVMVSGRVLQRHGAHILTARSLVREVTHFESSEP